MIGWGGEVGVVDLAVGSVLGENAVEEVGLNGFESADGRALEKEEEASVKTRAGEYEEE